MRTRVKKIVFFAAIALFVLALSGYVLYQAHDILEGPIISISTPTNWSTSNNSFVSITGSASNISFLRLDGRQIYIDEKGDFNESLLLPEGYTIMTIEAQDRFGRTVSKTLHLFHPATSSLL